MYPVVDKVDIIVTTNSATLLKETLSDKSSNIKATPINAWYAPGSQNIPWFLFKVSCVSLTYKKMFENTVPFVLVMVKRASI